MWEYVPLENAAEICDGLRKPINSQERAKRIEGKAIDSLYPYYGATGQVGYIDDYLTEGEFVLLGEDGAPFLNPFASKAYIISGKTWVNNHAHILRSKTNNRFLCYYLNYFNYNGYVSGTTRLKLTQAQMKQIKVPVPPIDEQARIVARIEELFSELDNGVQTLQTIKQQLAVYRQAVLKEAFERVDADEITLSAVCDFITKGTTPKKEDMSLGSGDIPYIKVYNLTFNTRLDFSINPTFVSKETHHNFLGRSITMPGDVLMNIVGPPLGKVSIVPDSYPEWNINQAIVRFRCLDKIYNKFLAYYLSFSETVDRMKAKAKATAGQQNLTLEICRCITIPLPSIEVQHQMVDEIESRLSVCDSIEKTVDTALTQAEAMRQSILKKAFEGGLV